MFDILVNTEFLIAAHILYAVCVTVVLCELCLSSNIALLL